MNKYKQVVLTLRALQLTNIIIWIGIAYLAYEIHHNLGIMILLYIGDTIVKRLFTEIQSEWIKK